MSRESRYEEPSRAAVVMNGRRYLLKAQLEKERLELERQREEEDARRRKEVAGVRESASVEVPSSHQKPPSVTVEVPPDILQVCVCVCV